MGMQLESLTTIRLRAPLFSVKRFIAKALCHSLFGQAIAKIFKERIPSGGCVIHTGSSAVLPSIKASLFWGIYESAEIRFVKKYLRDDLDVIELGSSLGVVTGHISRKLKPDARVICVEANPYLLETLRKNVEENCNGRSVNIVHGAVTDKAEGRTTIDLFIGDDNTASHTGVDPSRAFVTVPALTLSDVVRGQNIRRDFALVSDIEGAEVSFIENDKAALLNCKQIIIELHETIWKGSTVTVDRLRLLLESVYGFRLLANHGPVCVFERP
jgi:FkbM family methyltransferase